MSNATPRLYLPALGGIYNALSEFAEPILRIALGAILIPHGMQKLFGSFGGMGLTANAALFDKIGYSPGMFWGTLVGLTELVGGIMLVIGLFTRFAAAAVLIFMLVAIKFTSAKGFFWTAGGMEFPILLGVVRPLLRHSRQRPVVGRPQNPRARAVDAPETYALRSRPRKRARTAHDCLTTTIAGSPAARPRRALRAWPT